MQHAPRPVLRSEVLSWALLTVVCLVVCGPAPAQPEVAPANSLADALDREISRAETHSRSLDTLGTQLQRDGSGEREQLETAGVQAAEMAGQLQIHAAGSPEIEALYDEIVDRLGHARRALGAALDRAAGPTAVPVFEPTFDPTGIEVPALEPQLQRLETLRRELQERHRALGVEERELRRASFEGWGAITARLNTLRISAIQRLPEARRRKVLGIGREGLGQLRREIEHLVLSVRFYRAHRMTQLDRLPRRLLDVFTLGAATWTLLKVGFLLGVFFFLRQRGKWIRNGAHVLARRAFATSAARRRAELLVRLGEVVAPWSLFLALLVALRASLGALARESAELDLLLRIASLYGLYRLAIDVLFAGTLRVVRYYRLSLDKRLTAEVLRSVRTMMRVVVGILVMLVLSGRLVGRGHLYHIVVRFSWIFVLAAAMLLLARWRRPIADAYLGLGGGGRLARLVDGSRERWYGVFVSAAAFVLLAGRVALRLGRDFAMGFDQTRRALAFMFRRRIEKRAEQRGYADGNIEELPPLLVEAFAETPVTAATSVIDHYPGLDRLRAMIDSWLEHDVGASFLLSGEKGMGKTSWLQQVSADEVPVQHVKLNHRLLSESRLMGTLIEELDLPLERSANMPALHKALLAGPKRIILIDRGQNLFLGKVGGYDTFESFVSLVEATCARVLWVCSISAFAWEHLASVRPDLVVFRDREILTAWSEELIGKMLRARTEAAGVEVVYDDLILDSRGSRDPTLRTETAEQYTRLLWDYSDGNPRAALHYWLRSLVPESERRMRVRLFRAPAPADLEGLGERSRFLLAAIVVHENLSLQEATETTRYPMAVCRIQLERLHDDGILRREQGRYRLTTHWHRAVVRFLKRTNLLSD